MLNINPERVRIIKSGVVPKAPVLYWMSRDQRISGNWALLYAQEMAVKRSQPLYVVFNRVADFLSAGNRHYRFLFLGLKEVSESLHRLSIPFFITHGDPKETIVNRIYPKSIMKTSMRYSPDPLVSPFGISTGSYRVWTKPPF